jgi:hypothetical protein
LSIKQAGELKYDQEKCKFVRQQEIWREKIKIAFVRPVNSGI